MNCNSRHYPVHFLAHTRTPTPAGRICKVSLNKQAVQSINLYRFWLSPQTHLQAPFPGVSLLFLCEPKAGQPVVDVSLCDFLPARRAFDQEDTRPHPNLHTPAPIYQPPTGARAAGTPVREDAAVASPFPLAPQPKTFPPTTPKPKPKKNAPRRLALARSQVYMPQICTKWQCCSASLTGICTVLCRFLCSPQGDRQTRNQLVPFCFAPFCIAGSRRDSLAHSSKG